MIDAALKQRGIAAWQARARQLHDEANLAADYGDLKLSLMLRRCAFDAEAAACEWQSSEARL